MARKKTNKVFQIKITLINSDPLIWRRLLVSPETELIDLHEIIQSSMEWEDYHLYQFIHKGTFYVDSEELELYNEKFLDYSGIKIKDLLKRKGSSLIYEYDFGDCWEHQILLESQAPEIDSTQIPVCLAGERAGPPEDSGGCYGYQCKLEIASDPKHPDHTMIREWLGLDEGFEPEKFDLAEINKRLKKF